MAAARPHLSFGVASVDVLSPPVEGRHHIQVRIVVHGQHDMFAVRQSQQDWGGLHGTHQDLVPEAHTRFIQRCRGTHSPHAGVHICFQPQVMLRSGSHVSGVALQFQDGGGEAEPLVAVSSQNVPLRNDVVRGGAHQLVAISTPAANPQHQA